MEYLLLFIAGFNVGAFGIKSFKETWTPDQHLLVAIIAMISAWQISSYGGF
jgi:hypothetical protein